MRLWSIHPKYLDNKGLVALWCEGLLAKKVLAGKTRGYKNHPQLVRFKQFPSPIKAIESYLYFVYEEGKKRGYNFERKKLSIKRPLRVIIPVSSGQVAFEFCHLKRKLKERDRKVYKSLRREKVNNLDLNPVFYLVSGGIEEWEKR